MRYAAILLLLLSACGFMGGDPPWNWDENRIEVWRSSVMDCTEGTYVIDKRKGPTYIMVAKALAGTCNPNDYDNIRLALEDHGPTTQSIRTYEPDLYPPLLQVIADLRIADPGASWPDPELRDR